MKGIEILRKLSLGRQSYVQLYCSAVHKQIDIQIVRVPLASKCTFGHFLF